MVVPEVHVCDEKREEKRPVEQDLPSTSSEGHRRPRRLNAVNLQEPSLPLPLGTEAGVSGGRICPSWPEFLSWRASLHLAVNTDAFVTLMDFLLAIYPLFHQRRLVSHRMASLGTSALMISFQWLW